MKSRPRVRYQLRLEADLAERFERMPGGARGHRNAIISTALRMWLERHGQTELETQLAPRLGQMSAHLARLERDQQIVLESLALFIRLNLQRDIFAVELDAEARRRGRDRFAAFTEEVGRRLAQEHASFSDLTTPGWGERDV
ncbi:MAG TPA: CopG family transcriptional regulator [Asticcacaulis sp.]|nr:CopG family transcriptional regulator [Asticcacaulis sp.]